MRVNRLRVRNYRGFEELDLELDPKVTVLVGVNGAGKTSILDAIAGLLAHFLREISQFRLRPVLTASDVRVGAPRAEIAIEGSFGSKSASWGLTVTKLDLEQPPEPAFDEAVWTLVDEARESLLSDRPNLPLAVYFPTHRVARDIDEHIQRPNAVNPLISYQSALAPGETSFREFFEWFRLEEDLLNEEQARRLTGAEGTTDNTEVTSHLPLVREAIERLFPGGKSLRIERRRQRMTISIRGMTIDVASLSEGEKCLIAMTGDLARRMVLAAPTAANPLEHPAVVLIDEIELHLHPGLQRTILPRLLEVFPKTQFIVSTHSPQVLSSVHAKSVRLLRDFKLQPVERSTWHRDTNMILEGVFDDPGRPEDVARKLNELRDAVDKDDFDRARALIAELRSQIEGEDPDVEFLADLVPPEEDAG